MFVASGFSSGGGGGGGGGGSGGGDSSSRAYPLAQTALNLIAWALAVAATATPYATRVTATSTIDINFFEWCVTSKLSSYSGSSLKRCKPVELDTFPCEDTFTMHEVGRAMGVLACIALGIGWILGATRMCVSGSSRTTPRQIQEWLMRGAVPCCAIAFAMTMTIFYRRDCNKWSFAKANYDVAPSGPLFVAAAWFAIIGSSIRMCSCCTDDEVEDDANNNDNNNNAAASSGGGASLRMQMEASEQRRRQEEDARRRAVTEMAHQLGMQVVAAPGGAAAPPVAGVPVAPPPAGYDTTNLAFGVPPPPSVVDAPSVPPGFAAPPPSGPNFFGGPPPPPPSGPNFFGAPPPSGY